MKTTTKTWGRALIAAVSLCAVDAWADCYTYNTAGGTANLGSGTQIDSTDRLLVRKGTVNINEGASIKCGGNTAGSWCWTTGA